MMVNLWQPSARRLRFVAMATMTCLLLLAASQSGTTGARAMVTANLTQVSRSSPYIGCIPIQLEGQSISANYPNTEVETRLAVDGATVGTDHLTMVGIWQQDRWATGGARGLV